MKASKGLEYFFRFNEDDNARARQLAEEAIALDPNYAYGYSLLGHTHAMSVMRGWTKSPSESLEKAFDLGQKAIALDDGQETAHRLLGSVYLIRRQFDKALAKYEKATAVAPNSSFAFAGMGQILDFMGRSDEAVEALKKAFRMNPFPPAWFGFFLGKAYISTGHYNEAIEVYRKHQRSGPGGLNVQVGLAAAYGLAGREEEASAVVTEIFKINPKFNAELYAKSMPYINQARKDLWIEGLRRAGLK